MPRDIIVILRGVHPDGMVVIGDVLIQCGITAIEVPLNSHKPFDSIRRLTNHYRLDAQIGAGTVLSVKNVQRVVELGSQLIVSARYRTRRHSSDRSGQPCLLPACHDTDRFHYCTTKWGG